MPEEFKIEIGPEQQVTGLLYPAQEKANITILLGHGAGAGQTSGFMVNFGFCLYSEKRTDPP